ncbi:MAG: YfhO family protein, partial [Rhodothermia bacterium]
GVGKRYLPSDAYVEGSFEKYIPEYDFDRFIKEKVKEAGGSGRFRTLSLENSPTDWARPAYFYEISSGYNAAKLRVYQDLINHLGIGGQGRPPNETMLDLTGTRFIVGRDPLPGTTPVFSDQSTGLTVFERPRDRWGARTHLVDSVVVVSDAAAVLTELKRPTFDRQEIAILLTDPGPLGRIDSTSVAEVELTSYTAHEAEWSVKSDARRLLVSSEIYYPAGWTATVDGEATEILQVNHAFRAVIVPAGEHVVRMKFRPESHFRGVWISLISTILVYGVLAVLIGFYFVRRRRDEVT